MRKLMKKFEDENKKKEERAREVFSKIPEMSKDIIESLDRALELAGQDVLCIRKV